MLLYSFKTEQCFNLWVKENKYDRKYPFFPDVTLACRKNSIVNYMLKIVDILLIGNIEVKQQNDILL